MNQMNEAYIIEHSRCVCLCLCLCVYYPDFLHGKAGYFDVLVRNSLQPAYVTKSVIWAEAAVEVGELEKDSHHVFNVVASGIKSYLSYSGWDPWPVDSIWCKDLESNHLQSFSNKLHTI
jgi:S-adenosylmethionine:diacylglycerol 3-amino-3-carboxypropyl transferase